MDNRPIRDERILHAIEACRPGSDDLADPELEFLAAELEADPELADLYDRLQFLDAKLAVAFRDVPTPEGLEQRLLDRLAAAQVEQTIPADSATAASPRPKRISRKLLWAAGGVAGVAAAVLVAAWIGVFGPEQYNAQAVLDEAIRFCREDSREAGVLLADRTRQPDYPISREIARVPGIRWRPVNGFVGCKGVAFDIRSRGGSQATLYVVQRELTDPLFRPTPRPSFSTGGHSASTWMEAGLLYVLVVDGGTQAYQGFIAPRGPLT